MAKKKSKKRKVIQKNIRLTPEKYIKRHARKLPIVKTLVTDSILENGLGHVIVVRQKKNEELILGMYLIDMWCLGLKDTIYKISHKWEIEEIIQFYTEDIIAEEVDQSYAFNLVYGSIEFAEDSGFEPHKDFSITEFILPPVESIEFMDIEFGVNGLPHYEINPEDKVKKILKTLEKTRGKDNFTISFDNEFDGDISDDYLANILDVDVDQEIKDSPFYRKTLTIIEVVLAIYQNDYIKLKYDYTNNPEKINSRILENIKSNESFYSIPPKEFTPLIYPTIENLLIFENEDYLFLKRNMYSFIAPFDPNDQIINSIINISLVQYGSLKLEILFNLILKLCCVDDMTVAQSFLEDLLENFSNGNTDFVQNTNYIILKNEVELALSLIDQHKNKVGPIHFNEITLQKIEGF